MSPVEQDLIIEQELDLVREGIRVQEHLPADVQRVLQSLRDHLFEEAYDINAIIECSEVRKASIYGRFKVCVGMSLRAYQEERRMEAARRLLRSRELEIYLVAYLTGYGSHTSFARAFRRCIGCTPTAYREKMTRENDGRNLCC